MESTEPFTGRLAFLLELKCSEADRKFIEDNLRMLMEERVERFLDVEEAEITVTAYPEKSREV